MALENEVSGCFGVMDCKFAGHFLDESRAKELRSSKAYTMQDKIDACEAFLRGKGCSEEHIESEMKKVRKFFK